MKGTKNIFIKHAANFTDGIIDLPASKSIANRALILNALSGSQSTLENISEARDTRTMRRLLASKEDVLDVLDAGTTMRFLTAYLTCTNQAKVLTGSLRMQERPIKILVDALVTLGGDIEYLASPGYPPLRINSFDHQKTDRLTIRGDVSSQYISAIMMIAPLLKKGLTIMLEGKIGSKPYIEMTRAVMKSFGVKSQFDGMNIIISPQQYMATTYVIEPDWSAAGYWFSLVALSAKSSIKIKGLKETSIQGDSRIVGIMKSLGVATDFDDVGATLTKIDCAHRFTYDFTDCPDLAQTVAVICAAKGVEAVFVGLESLKIKETDRVFALQQELKKMGAQLIEKSGEWLLHPAHDIPERLFIHTYDDHRMAMAFAPLAMVADVEIENSGVVSKSYPGFWNDLKQVGLNLREVD